ncbi:MAG TPA: c-type cytochrome [Candidatus Limnocylindrales bacterium]|nr:c-type cytochrome [Candidatus Limnocylindrales bacterium]
MFRRRVLMVAGCVAFAPLPCAWAQSQTVISPKPAEQVYKNIQVLKGTPADQLIPAMQFITQSLGVRCEHCHVEHAFDSDDKKPKQTARKMIQMVLALNQNNFAGERDVTCYSCHRGNLRPANTPAVASETTAPKRTPAAISASRSVDQVLTKYLQAIGGDSALQAAKTQGEKGVVNLGNGVQFPVEIYTKSPGMRCMTMHLPTGDSLEVVSGPSGWISVPGRPVHEMNSSDLLAAHLDADLQFAADIKSLFPTIESRPDTEIDGHKVNVIFAISPGLPPVELYFDAESGLLVRMVRYVESPLGRTPTQIDFSDYRVVAGTKVPYQRTISQPQGRFLVQLQEIQRNLPIEDSRFAEPVTGATTAAQ